METKPQLSNDLYESTNSLRPRQNGRHFADDILKRFFLNGNVSILIKISLLKFVQLDYRRIYASLGLNELRMMFHLSDTYIHQCAYPKVIS